MVEREPIRVVNIDEAGKPPLQWDAIRAVLTGSHGPQEAVYLATVRPDGRPHVAGIAIVWIAGDFVFTSGPNATKSRNLAVNPACTLAGRIGRFDFTADGIAERVTDRLLLEQAVEYFRADEWPATIVEKGISAPWNAQTAGPPPWNLYRMRYASIVVVGHGPEGQATRFEFANLA